jgi:hypothetical protein
MKMIDNEGLDLAAIGIHGLIALLFGAMKQLNAIKEKGFKTGSFVINATVSSFVGIAVFFACAQFFPSQHYLTAFATSIAGWAGGNMMDFFSEAMQKILAKRLDVEVNKNTEETQSLLNISTTEINHTQ